MKTHFHEPLLSISLAACLSILSACTALVSSSEGLRLYDGPQLHPSDEATLILPESLEIVEFNQREIMTSFFPFRNDVRHFRVPAGTHHLTVRYQSIWQINADEHESHISPPVVFIWNAIAGIQYELRFKLPENIDAARHLASKPELYLWDGQQQTLGAVQTKAPQLTFNSASDSPDLKYPHLEQLKFWWRQTSLLERQAFKDWISNQGD